jgi:hypothetical protein
MLFLPFHYVFHDIIHLLRLLLALALHALPMRAYLCLAVLLQIVRHPSFLETGYFDGVINVAHIPGSLNSPIVGHRAGMHLLVIEDV